MNLHPALVAGRLAHDFGNYLTSILGFAELAAQEAPVESPARSNLAEVREAALRGAHWVQRLSFLGRPKTERIEPVDIPLLVDEAESRVRGLPKKKIKLKTAFDASFAGLTVDKEALRHVLAELIDNACEAMAESGTVTLSSRQIAIDDAMLTAVSSQRFLVVPAHGDYVEIAIADTGSGLPTDFHKKIRKEPFFCNKPGHRGFGLLIVRWVVEQNGGGLEFGHTSRGAVVRVFFRIPPTNT